MKKAKLILLIGAGLFALYAIVMLIMNAVMYGAYIEYYGLGQVLPTILESFFGYAGWAFALFGLAAIVGILTENSQVKAIPTAPAAYEADEDEIEEEEPFEVLDEEPAEFEAEEVVEAEAAEAAEK